MSDIPMITSFRGQNIEEMDRAGLLECIRYLAPIVQERFSPENIRAHALGSVEMMRRGL